MNKTYKILLSFLLVLVTSLGFSQSVPSYVPTNGLVGWWGFNGNAQDNSGNGNHGTVNGATLTTDRFGNLNGAYIFNGQNNRINITNQIFNLGWQNYTISAWFQTSNLNNANNFNNSSIILNTAPHNGIAISYYGTNNPFSTSVSNKISVLGGNGSGWNYFNYGTLVSNKTISAHTWNHVLLTRNGSNFLLYLNGNLSDSLFLNTSQINQTCELVFGNIAGTISSEGFLGRLDDYGIWNRTLSHQEISSLYQSGGIYESLSIQGVQNWNWLADDGFNVPSGSLDLGGVPFFIGSGGTGWAADRHPGANPRICNVPVIFNGCSEIFFLLNTIFGSPGTPLAEIKLFFSDGTQLLKSLQGNVDVRDYTEGFYTNTINNTTTVNIFPTLPVGPGGRRLDRVQFSIPSLYRNKTLTNIQILDYGTAGVQRLVLTGITLSRLNSSLIPGGITIPTINSCLGDTSSVTISYPTLTGVANASLRMTYNPDSLTYVGFNSLNPAFSGMTISGGNGSVLMDWNTSTNQTIAAGNMVNLRFRVNGNSNLNWDTTTIPCEFSDVNFNVVPQTYVSGSITQNTQRLTWNRDICQGQSFTLGNQSYTTSGTYQGRSFGTGGACDTLITLNLNIIPTQTNLPAVTTCSNQPYSFNGLSLTTSGTYLDTLINSLGCDSILQLNLTVNPAYNQNQSVVICTGTTYSFGGQSLSSSGTYSHTYTTANGCDSLVQLNLSVADSVSIQSANGSVGFCPGGSLRIGLVNPIPNVTYQWTKDGSPMTGANTDSLMVTQSGVYQLTVQVSPTCSVISNIINISVLNCNRITGDLKYDNNNQTPLAGVPVHLKTLLGNMVASDTTDATGGYEMSGYNNGNYVLDANVNYAWGGVNSTDALQVTRFFTSLITLSPLRIRVGDVNGSGITNSGDALLINRRITGLIPSFSVGNFVNNLPSVSASGNPIAANLRVLSTGDVNGTYNPLPLAPALVLDTVYGNGNVGTAVVRFTTAGSGVFERGIVWSSSPNPTLTSNKSIAGTGGFGFTHTFSSIDLNNIQYARAYARTSAGVYYSNERSFTSVPWNRCPGTPSVTDIDGNVYNTVQIGTQCWTQSNLKVSKYRNGDNIPTGLSNSDWSSTMAGAYSIYNNDPVNDGLYGKLYNQYAVTDSRGICPTGWHVPSDGEWTSLENHLGGTGVAGGKMKSTDFYPAPGGWFTYHYSYLTTNSSGFTGLPGGTINNPSSSNSIGTNGFWWSYTTTSNGIGWSRYLAYSNEGIIRHSYNPIIGFSVRCLKNTLPQVNTTSVTNVTPSTALVTGEVISEGDQNTVRGFCYSTTPNPTILNDTAVNGTGLGVYSRILQNLTSLTTYYVRAYATNSLGTSYGNEVVFTSDSLPGVRCPGTPTVTDIDGNVYNTVQIGTQCWTQSNLKVSKYRNGDNLPTGLSNSDWSSTMAGAYSIYNNDPVNDGLYGKLYNFNAVTDSRGLCPTGWHVPSDGAWNAIVKFLDSNADTACGNCNQSTIAGGFLKSNATQTTHGGWISPNIGATNSSGFTALPGGVRGPAGEFLYFTSNGFWWSSTASFGSNAWFRNLSNGSTIIYNGDNATRPHGFSVRCLKNTLPQVNTTSVTNVTPSTGLVTGEVISEGDQNTIRGFCYSTIPNPTISNDTTMNGAGLGVYTGIIPNLNPSTTYYVRAYATNSLGTSYGNEVIFSTYTSNGFSSCGAVSDIDGNHYQTVLIGSQCWTQSNLRTSRYINGDSVVTGLSDSSWSTTNQGAFIISQYPSDFGFYYNHYAAIDSRGICPSGWRLPSENDWNLLIKTVDNLADTGCINWCEQSTWGAMSLKSSISYPHSPIGWSLAYVGGAGTNSSGFSSLPAGGISTMGHFMINSSGRGTNYWSTSLINMPNVPTRMLVSDNHKIFKALESQNYGFSVRCIKNL